MKSKEVRRHKEKEGVNCARRVCEEKRCLSVLFHSNDKQTNNKHRLQNDAHPQFIAELIFFVEIFIDPWRRLEFFDHLPDNR